LLRARYALRSFDHTFSKAPDLRRRFMQKFKIAEPQLL
jgi:hypothetical protein